MKSDYQSDIFWFKLIGVFFEANSQTMTTEEVRIHELSDKDSQFPSNHSSEKEKIGTDPNYKRIIVWKNVAAFFVLHIAALYGLSLILRFQVKFATVFWSFLMMFFSGEGITMGAHRYYSHRSFKATFTLRLILVILQTLAGQNCMYIWVRDHRLHHKYSDTDADPHNANRGFFFSHVGWLLSRKHPLVKEKGKTIDMSDLEADPIVMFQKEWYFPLYFALAVIFPAIVPVYFWNETVWNSFFISYILRNVLVLNQTWTVNSLAHIYGYKPFDKKIRPSENSLVSFLTVGEGWHNYHHTFPWDYRASEYGTNYTATTNCIEYAEKLGIAHDLKTASYNMIFNRSKRTGDGTKIISVDNNKNSQVHSNNEQKSNGQCKALD